jgi:hypothetical protein
MEAEDVMTGSRVRINSQAFNHPYPPHSIRSPVTGGPPDKLRSLFVNAVDDVQDVQDLERPIILFDLNWYALQRAPQEHLQLRADADARYDHVKVAKINVNASTTSPLRQQERHGA